MDVEESVMDDEEVPPFVRRAYVSFSDSDDESTVDEEFLEVEVDYCEEFSTVAEITDHEFGLAVKSFSDSPKMLCPSFWMPTLRNMNRGIVFINQTSTCNRIEDVTGPEAGESITEVLSVSEVEDSDDKIVEKIENGSYEFVVSVDGPTVDLHENDVKTNNLHGHVFERYVKYVGEDEYSFLKKELVIPKGRVLS
jgi:hypothetical protein